MARTYAAGAWAERPEVHIQQAHGITSNIPLRPLRGSSEDLQRQRDDEGLIVENIARDCIQIYGIQCSIQCSIQCRSKARRPGRKYILLSTVQRSRLAPIHVGLLTYLGRTVVWSLDSSSRNLASSSCGTVRRGSEGAKAEGEGTGKGEGGGEGKGEAGAEDGIC